MNLKIERLPSSLSPSALAFAEKQPNKYYLTRLINDGMEGDPQGLAASVGSAFDYYIKVKLVEEKFPNKLPLMDDIRKGIETNIDEAFRWGKQAFNLYTMMAYDVHEYADIELHNNFSLDHLGTKIPLYGKLDATAFHKLRNTAKTITIPFDWKMSGYTAKDAVSPYPGYYWSAENGVMLKGRHKFYDYGMSFEEINPGWATQLCTYGWLIGISPGTPFPARVDMLCFGRGKKITIAKYCGWITIRFQEQVALRYMNLWNSLMSGQFIDRLASQTDENLVWAKAQTETWWK